MPIYPPKSAIALVVAAVAIASLASVLHVAGAVSADAARAPVIAGFAIATLLWIAAVRRRDRRLR